MPSQASAWVSGLRRQTSTALRLFCFPYAGGGASIFRRWHGKMPPGVELWPVQLPGREDRLRERPLTDIRQLAECAAEAFQNEVDVPSAVFGHSMGALIAFEFADVIRSRAKRSPVHLIVSGYQSPRTWRPTRPLDPSDEEFIQELKRLKGSPAAVFEDEELLQMLLPVLRADFQAVDTYTYRPRQLLDCPITAIGGTDDCEFPPDSVQGWRSETRGNFTLKLVPGDHFFLNTAEELVLAHVCDALRGHL